MALFQITAIKKYSTAQDQKVLKEKWEAYKVHFHDSNIQENIRNAEFLKEFKKKTQPLSTRRVGRLLPWRTRKSSHA